MLFLQDVVLVFLLTYRCVMFLLSRQIEQEIQLTQKIEREMLHYMYC